MKRLQITALLPALALATTLALGEASAQFVDVAAGPFHSLALQADGQVLAWGSNISGACDVPAQPGGLTFVEVAAGGQIGLFSGASSAFSLGRRNDGSIVAWGNDALVNNIPALPPGVTYTGVAGGSAHALALRSDGSVVAWGDNSTGACDVPDLPPGLTYVEISAGGKVYEFIDCCSSGLGSGGGFCQPYPTVVGLSAARRSDGSVVVWGDWDGLWDVPALPPGLTYVEISAGADHMAALRSDGSVVAWGANTYGQCDVPAPPAGLVYVGLEAGAGHTTARLSDGSLVESGIALAAPTTAGWVAAPPLPPGVSYVDLDVGGIWAEQDWWDMACNSFSGEFAWGGHVVALRSDGSVVAWGDNSGYQVVDPWSELGGGTEGVAGTPTLTGDGTPLEGEVISVNLANVLPGEALLAWISFAPAPFPALGGTVHAYPFASQLFATAGTFGTFNGSVFWPAGIPSGTQVWFQFLVQDVTVSHGITLSNGLKLEVP